MRTPLVLTLMLSMVSTTALANPNRRGGPPYAVPAGAEVSLPGDPEMRDIRVTLRDLRGLISTLRNQAMVAEMQRRLDRVDRKLARLDTVRWNLIDTAAAFEADALRCNQALDLATRAPVPRLPRDPYREDWYPAEPTPPPGPLVTAPDELARIQGAIEQASFSKDKLAVLRSASRERAFTSEQVLTLVRGFSFGNDKVEAAALLHPKVVDPENWYVVYGAFDFESDKRKLRQRIGD